MHPQEAWKWINFLSRQLVTVQDDKVPDSGPTIIPARKSVAEAVKFWDTYDVESQAAALWTLAHDPSEMNRPRETQVLDVLTTLTYNIFSKPTMSPHELLADAQAELTHKLADAALTPTPAPSKPIVVATPQPAISADGRTSISFGVYGRSLVDLQQLVERFHEQQSNVFVNLSQAGTPNGGSTNDALGTANDCFLWSGAPPDAAATRDLAPLMNADAAFPPDAYPPLLLAPYTSANGLYGIPLTVRFRALHYNRDVRAASGTAAPNAAWTPDDFLQHAQAGTFGIGDTAQYGYVPYTGAIPDMLFFMHQLDGRPFVGSGARLQPNFTNPQVIAAINWYLDLDRLHHVMPPLKTLVSKKGGGSAAAMQLVRSGRATMWFGDGFRSVMPGQGEAVAFSEGLAPLPVGRAGFGSSDMYMQSLHIAAKTQHAQACWQWMTFLSTDGSAASWPGVLPARHSVAQNSRLPEASEQEQALFQSYTQLVMQRKATQNETWLDLQSPAYQWFFGALQAVILQNANLEEQLTEAQTKTEAFLACQREGKSNDDCVKQVGQ